MKNYLPLLACSLLCLSACGDDGDSNPGNDGGVDMADASNPNTPDAFVGDFTTLIEGTWTKPPGGNDTYWCSWVNVTEDMYITGFDAIAPLGTHHTVVSVTDDYSGPNKEEACGAGDIANQMLFASGVGTSKFALPDGVAIKVTAGQTLMLNLHLYNISDDTIAGTSGTRVTTTALADVQDLAEFFFAGPINLSIPAGASNHTASGSCSMLSDGHIFALWPHMHQVGKHMTITHGTTTVLDTDYSFEEQKMYPMTAFPVKTNDSVNVECTWDNTGGPARSFGDQSDDEMCFGGIYRYPVSGQDTFCFGF